MDPSKMFAQRVMDYELPCLDFRVSTCAGRITLPACWRRIWPEDRFLAIVPLPWCQMVYLLDRRTFENYVRRCLRRTDNRDEFARNVPEQAIKTKIDDRGRVYIPTKIWRFMGWPPPKKVKLAGLGRGKIALCHWEG